jgi:hypothetical protein
MEMLLLARFGWTGWALSWVIGSWVTGKMMEIPAKGALLLAYHEFNALHHGNKAAKQHVEVLEELVVQGEKGKVEMAVLREVCRQVRKSSRNEESYPWHSEK